MANKVSSPTAGMTFPRPKPDTPPSMVKKIGKTTYRSWAHFSETSTETMEDKIKRMLREEVRQMMAQEKTQHEQAESHLAPGFCCVEILNIL